MRRSRHRHGSRSGRPTGLRRWLLPLALGAAATLATSAVTQQTIARYADIDACIAGCTVAAGGWPLPYLIDYPGPSPGHDVSLVGAAMGADRLRLEGLALDLAFWIVSAFVLMWLLRRIRR